ncbi:uncharacterized protein [Nicotiana tomentosiformis]|uniref:uncharacterized protein n=1 Tax=Nicotiana tomentosiformis TaxID=4098 RepID=UPI00388CB52C
MAKTSQTIPQKEKASSSQPAADKTPVEPRPEECVPGTCVLTSDFKVDKGSSVPGRCVGKDAVLRPSSVEEEAPASIPTPVKDNKSKRASAFEDPKSKMRTARKPRKSTIPLTVESVLHLRDENEEEEEEEEEEENDGAVLADRMKKSIDAPKAVESMVICKASPRTEEILEEDSGKVPESLEIEDAFYGSQHTVGTSKWAGPEALRTEENAPSESLGAIVQESEAAETSNPQSRRETLEEIHARGFDLTEEIKRDKELEADAEALASDDDDDDDDDDDGSKSRSKSGEEPDGDKTAPRDNQ